MASTVDPARVEALFHTVVDLPPEDAARILDAECPRAGDALRQAVERLLFHDRAAPPSFLAHDGTLVAEVINLAQFTGGREAPHEDELSSGQKVGRFTVWKRLGAGAMGVVYLGYDEALDRQVALKVLRRGLAWPEQLAREARALARLAHPNVVQIYEVGEHDERPFIAMELVSGSSVRGWLAEHGRAAAQILGIFVQAGRGLAAAHAAGLVHRDFKPDNVLVGADGRVRVVDFGISALVEPTGESEGSPVPGTPAFMAPEQFLGERATPASDQFAFCVAIYRSLFDVGPFVGDDIPTLRRNVVAGKLRVPAPSVQVPAWVHRILARGLARAPAERYPNMAALLDEIERRLPATPELDPTMGRRERRLIAAAMSLLGALLLAAVWWGRARLHAPPTNQQFVSNAAAALVLQACAAFAFRRRLLGNQFAQKVMLVVWIGILSVLLHRLVALRFGQPLPEVLCVDLLVLGTQHVVGAVVFDRWFALTAGVFLVSAALAFVWPASAISVMLGSVSLAYFLGAARIGL